MNRAGARIHSERGANLLEAGFLLLLIATVAIVAVASFGQSNLDLLNDIPPAFQGLPSDGRGSGGGSGGDDGEVDCSLYSEDSHPPECDDYNY